MISHASVLSARGSLDPRWSQLHQQSRRLESRSDSVYLLRYDNQPYSSPHPHFPVHLLVGYPPFSESASGTSLNDQIIKGIYTFPDEFWSDVSESAKDLIRKMMCVDPGKRLSMTEVLEHPWLANDPENTARVQQIMFPSAVPSAPTTKKRTASDEEVLTEGTRPVDAIPEKPAGRPKRAKRWRRRWTSRLLVVISRSCAFFFSAASAHRVN